ncbi:MAG: hypothetical protein II336_18190 [Loktanella sp.]|nr:hypothetical protein [Loktanella sp.]
MAKLNIPSTPIDLDVVQLDLGAIQQSASDAAASATQSEVARDQAFVSAGSVGGYSSTAAGLADTVVGDRFSAPDGGDIQLYVHEAGPVATPVEGMRYPAAAVASAIAQRQRGYLLPQRDTFVAGEVLGAYSANGVTLSNLVWDIGASGEINVTGNMSADNARLFWSGFERVAGQPMTATLRMSFANTSVDCRAMIAVMTPGDSATLQQHIIRNNGNPERADTGSNTNIYQRIRTSNEPASFGNNQTVTLTLAVNADGDGYLYAESVNGESSCQIVGLPSGRVYFGARTSSAWTAHGFKAASFDTTGDFVDARSPILTEENLLPSDLTDGAAIADGATTDNVWRFSVSGDGVAAVENIGNRLGVSLLNSAVRARIPIPSGAGEKLSWHFYMQDALGRNATTDDRFVLVQSDASGNEITRETVYLSGLKPGAQVGTVNIEPDCASVLYFIGTSLSPNSFPVKVSQASLCFSDIDGFRPWRPDVEVDLTEVETRLDAVEAELGVSSGDPVLLGWKILPNFPLDRNENQFPAIPAPSAGFTVTGADEIKTGVYKGCPLLGNDGRFNEQSGAPGMIYNPHVHVVDRNHDRILRSFPVGTGDHSVQGVATDTLTAAETFWVALAGNRTIRHYHLYGASAGTEISADVINFGTLGITPNPNGLAFDPDEGSGKGALWAGGFTGTTVWLIDCDPAASPRIIRTITLPHASADQFQLVKIGATRFLLYSVGPNGSNGAIHWYNPETNATGTLGAAFDQSTAIEGMIYRHVTRTVDVYNDAYFHSTNAKPQCNMVASYKVTGLPV